MSTRPDDRSRFRPGGITYMGKYIQILADYGTEGLMPERDPLLQEREKTHGNYTIQAGWAQTMKTLLRSTPNWNDKRGAQKESLDMIITKISRILHGAVDSKDHWEDISGYAKLGAENCE